MSCYQVRASMSKNFIEKKRNLKASCCEFCSHFLIIILLMFGYNLSEILHFDAEIYSTVNLSIPPSFVIDSTSGLLTDINNILSGPLAIPTFDQYMYANNLLVSSVSQTGNVENILSTSSFGQKFNNLLKKGTLHFAPSGKEVDNLISYLQNNTSTFSSITYYVHESESSGIDYILNNLDEYTLAFIVLEDVNTDSTIKYKIRQNYTTLPNTNQVVNWISIGLDTNYQEYILSGFLTLQSTVDDWLFSKLNASSNDTNNNNTQTCQKPNHVIIPFPTASFDQNIFYQAVGFLLGLAMTSKYYF